MYIVNALICNCLYLECVHACELPVYIEAFVFMKLTRETIETLEMLIQKIHGM